jgi:hypothetical protein
MEVIYETLRLEVAPFGVNVIEIVTGAVKSNGQKGHFDSYALPPDSLYKPIEGTIASRARGEDGVPRMDLEEYATAVVEDIVSRTAGKFWYGSNAEMVKMSTVAVGVPQSVVVSAEAFFHLLEMRVGLILAGCWSVDGHGLGCPGKRRLKGRTVSKSCTLIIRRRAYV